MTTDKNGTARHPAGVPTGGQFATVNKSEAPADVTLTGEAWQEVTDPAVLATLPEATAGDQWRQLTDDEFRDGYAPKLHPAVAATAGEDDDESDDDLRWRYEDLGDVAPEHVWSILEPNHDGNEYAVPGFGLVNHTGYYLVTEKPWNNLNQEVAWRVSEFMHEDGICDNCGSPVDGYDICPDCDTPVPESDPSVIAAGTLSNEALVEAGQEAAALDNPLAAADDVKPEKEYVIRVKGRIKHRITGWADAQRMADAEQTNYPDASVTVRDK